MRNRRNTRRGRAKRWRKMTSREWLYVPTGDVLYSDGLQPAMWWLERRTESAGAFQLGDAMHSRAAAMRAAEHLARQR